MAAEETKHRKRISVNQVRPGMYVIGLDQSWLQTPFLVHRKLIKSEEQIEVLRNRGIREVVIDTSRGVDDDGPEPFEQAVIDIDKAEPQPVSGARTSRPAVAAPAEITFKSIASELKASQMIHEHALAAAQSIFDGAGRGAPVSAQVAEKVVADLMGSISRSPEANLLLMQMRRFKKDLAVHAINVCVLSLVVNAEEFATDAIALGLGALLHDIGETRIPRNLLRKTESLTDSERRLMEQHALLGAKLLEHCEDIPLTAQRIVLEHHERIDGTGYPHRTSGADISLLSQIVAITDLYDDMLCGRHRVVMQPIDALRQLFVQSHSGALDSHLVERIIRSLGIYPIGSLVELNTGERGIVVAANRTDTLRPTLRIISSRLGVAQPHGPIVSLADSGGEERRIVGALNPAKERINPVAFLKLTPAAAGS